MCGGGLNDLGGLVPLSGGSCGSHSPITACGDYLSPAVVSPHGPHGFSSSQPSTCSSSEAYKGLLLFSPDALRIASPSRKDKSVLFYPGDVLAFAAVSEAAAAILERDTASYANVRRKLQLLRVEMRPGFDVTTVVSAMHSHEQPIQRRRRAASASSVGDGRSGSSAAASSPSTVGGGDSSRCAPQPPNAAIFTPLKSKRKRNDREPSSEPSTLTALDLALAREMPPAQCTRAAMARRRALLTGGVLPGDPWGHPGNVRDSGIVLKGRGRGTPLWMIKQKQEEEKHRREAQEASRQMKELEQKLMAGSSSDDKSARHKEGVTVVDTVEGNAEAHRDQQSRWLLDQEGWVPHESDPSGNWYYHGVTGTMLQRATQKLYLPRSDGTFRELSREEWLSMAMAKHDPAQELRLAADATMMQGRRAKMEDKHALLKDLKDIGRRLGYNLDHLPSPTGMYMVYDGHQGVTCAEYCIKQTHNKILPRLANHKEPITEEFMRKVFEDSFRELDEEFLAKYRTIPDGSTAVIALVIGIDLYVANIGDSACLLVQRVPAQTSAADEHHQQQRQHPNYSLEVKLCHTNHKPEDATEKDRIVKNGGAMVTPAGGVVRVAAADYEEKMKAYKKATNAGLGAMEKPPIALAVSRAFGDREFKTPNKLIISVPSVNHHTLSPETDIALVLVCDGVTDVMTPAMIGAKILQKRTESSRSSFRAFLKNSVGHRAPNGPLKLLRTGPAREVKKIRCKHILMKHKDVRNPRDRVRNKQVTRTKTEAENTMMSILADLRKDSSKFPELCKKHSECLSSRKTGHLCGDLDWFGHGKMMPEFEEAAFALDVGEMSDLVYSPSGIHIIVRIA
ncbi:hypothetical protein FOZ60_013332 [Perkinsus olseni]|uniref:PPM-type phosphatase domain-containing protein n=1 Tax=Perkinsus olseni TaxID=32597 RepID=A0A7J6PN83_PEROL|nr:hypothetical protein FOZ60_013332 [Perkinsus olseni]